MARGEAESGQTLAAYRSTRARLHLTKSTAADTHKRDIQKHMHAIYTNTYTQYTQTYARNIHEYT